MKRLLLLLLLLFLVAASPADDRKKLADTIQGMRVIDEAISLYSIDQNQPTPEADGMRALARLLVPAYVRQIPLKDAYGHDYVYSMGHYGYRIVSHGDGTRDIVLENGHFLDAQEMSGFVPWKPYDAPLANVSGTNPNAVKAARIINHAYANRAMADMRAMAVAVEDYATDQHHYPVGHTIGELASALEPRYIKDTPRLDPWQTPYRYASDKTGTRYTITCAGADLDVDNDVPASLEATADPAKDALLINGEFRRSWMFDKNFTLTPPPPPPPPPPHTPIQWTFEIVQRGYPVPAKDGIVKLRRAPFTIRVMSDEMHDVRLNALADDRIARRMQPGFDFTSCRKDIVAFCNGTALAEDDGNPNKRLALTPDAMHYLSDERWNRKSIGAGAFIFERDVATLGDTPIAKTSVRDVYLVAIIWTGDSPILADDELKKVRLQFR